MEFNIPKIVILPRQDFRLDGTALKANSDETILDTALRSGVEIEHAYERSCVCTTCYYIVREGFSSLLENSGQEGDMLDKVQGLGSGNRLGCQARVTDEDLVIEIPHHAIDHAREH